MTLAALCLSIFFGVVPMVVYSLGVRWFDRYEKEPWLLLIATFIWGVIIAAGVAFVVNTALGIGFFLVTGDERATDLFTGVLIAPFVEESIKGLAVLAVFLLFRREFDSLLDGILYASMVGFGFAATENVYYIFNYGYLEGGLGGLLFLVFIRVILVGFQHAFYTSFTGIGLATARLNRNRLVKTGAPLVGYGAAMFTHATHNLLSSVGGGLTCLVGTIFNWMGVLGMLAFIIYLVWRESRIVARYLRDEVASGLLTEEDYRVACSTFGQMAARWGALGQGLGHWRHTRRFLNLCGELAFKKYHLDRLGEERGNTARIERLRQELIRLSSGNA